MRAVLEVSSGALAKCTHIELGGNPASQGSKHAVQDALKRRWLDGEFLATHLNEATSLDMFSMKWGDAEMTKLAAALEYCRAEGALPQLKRLDLDSNQIGDVGMQALAGAVSKGALAALETLDLSVNAIGDAGMSALAKAITPGPNGKGALPALKELLVDNPEHAALKAACQARGIDLEGEEEY